MLSGTRGFQALDRKQRRGSLHKRVCRTDTKCWTQQVGWLLRPRTGWFSLGERLEEGWRSVTHSWEQLGSILRWVRGQGARYLLLSLVHRRSSSHKCSLVYTLRGNTHTHKVFPTCWRQQIHKLAADIPDPLTVDIPDPVPSSDLHLLSLFCYFYPGAINFFSLVLHKIIGFSDIPLIFMFFCASVPKMLTYLERST